VDILLEVKKLVSMSWNSMGWIEGAAVAGAAWRAMKRACEGGKQSSSSIDAETRKAISEVYFSALSSLQALLTDTFWIPDYEFTDTISGAIAALEPLPENEAKYFADLVEQRHVERRRDQVGG